MKPSDRKSTTYSFEEHALSKAHQTWLIAASQPDFDHKAALFQLWDQLPDDFDPESLDRRFYVNGRLTILGLWHVCHDHPVFELIDRVVFAIRDELSADPKRDQITAEELASKLQASEQSVSEALHRLGELGRFFHGAGQKTGINEYFVIGVNDESVHKMYLRYKGIKNALETYYAERGHIAKLTQMQAHWPSVQDPFSANGGAPKVAESNQTRVERHLHHLKNHPIIAFAVIIGIVVIAFSNVIDAIAKLPTMLHLLK